MWDSRRATGGSREFKKCHIDAAVLVFGSVSYADPHDVSHETTHDRRYGHEH
jgi:hypothetical protein